MQEMPDAQWQRAIEYFGELSELKYMTQIVFMLYEDPKAGTGKIMHLFDQIS